MKKCPECNFVFDSSVFNCPKCKFVPSTENNIQIFAPGLAKNSDYMPSGHYDKLKELEDRGYWWFVSRSKLILFLFEQFFKKAQSFCEIGCGGGYILSKIAEASQNITCYGTEVHLNGLLIAQKWNPKATLFQSDLLKFPFEKEFDVIGAFDVIEHIEDDVLGLKNIYNAVKPGGGIMISVPQHKWLYGKKDEYGGHKRRYTKKELIRKVAQTGFKISKVISFTSLLFPLFCLSRITEKNTNNTTKSIMREFNISSFTNGVFSLVMAIELIMVKFGINFPFGGSLFIVAQKY